jgi:superfamily II DNA or RNA helicase
MPADSIDHCRTCDTRDSTALAPLPLPLHAGCAVLVRGQRCRLDAITSHNDCHELHLTCAADGRARILLWPFDRPEPLERNRRLRAVRPRTWIVAVRRAAALTIGPLTPRSSGRDVDGDPFQLAPAIAIASGACRLLLADEVGLGKTIQAGWIVSDAIARKADTRILLAVPAAVRHQWASELSTRFGLEPALVDARWLRDAVSDLPADISPFAAPGVYLGSLDFVKRPDVADTIARHIWDLIVVDEAHTAAAPTDRHAALERFAERARRVVSITATPYSGSSGGLASLTSIGALQNSDPPLMFRRSRTDVGDARQRRHRFVRVRITSLEARLQRLLERYSRDVWNEPVDDTGAARLAMTILRKRALSSPAAAARSLRRRLELLQGHGQAPRQLLLFDDDEIRDDDVPAATLAAPGLADAAREHRWLASLIAAADAAHQTDSKLRHLRRLIARIRGESIVVFTEYRDTLLQLAASLPPSLQLHGGLTSSDRAAVQRRFNAEGGLLLATDAAAEGLNLHQQCRLVVNYELPWNPARLEQRIGRVDRIGQRRTVHALTLTARDTAEDLVIVNLARRLSRVVATFGVDDRLGEFLNDARTAGIVIGGDSNAVMPESDADETSFVVRDRGDLRHANQAASQVSARRSAVTPSHALDQDVLVSSMRARPGTLDPGFVLAIAVCARTAEGFVAGCRQFLVHVSSAPRRPCSAADARQLAGGTIAAFDVRTAVPQIDSWFAEIRETHESSIAARIAREEAMLDRPRPRPALQPGLFDRRALADAERVVSDDEAIRELHRAEVAALERSRPLRLTCHVSGVLILWR